MIIFFPLPIGCRLLSKNKHPHKKNYNFNENRKIFLIFVADLHTNTTKLHDSLDSTD